MNEDLALRLFDAVADMRHHQQDYFRTRSQSSLLAAKAAEKRVDKLLSEIQQAPRLF